MCTTECEREANPDHDTDLPLNLNGSKNKSPCFHRPILIQIDSPLPHDDTQVVSRKSDVELQNKSTPNLIFHLFCL